MPTYNLLEFSQNYSITSGRLWNYYNDEIDGVDCNASDGKSFNYKTKILEKTPKRPPRLPKPDPPPDRTQPPRPPQATVPGLYVEVTIPLECLSNLWRSFDLSLTNCEIELDLSWSKEWVMSEHHNNITGAIFQINNAKLYIPSLCLLMMVSNF